MSLFYSSSSESSFSEDSFIEPTAEIRNNLTVYNNMLKVGLSNVQSIVPHFSEFRSYVYAGNFDIVAVTETWLKPVVGDHVIAIPDYNLIRNDRLHKGAGGVAVYVRNGITAKLLFASPE